jgi:hypothetical protein
MWIKNIQPEKQGFLLFALGESPESRTSEIEFKLSALLFDAWRNSSFEARTFQIFRRLLEIEFETWKAFSNSNLRSSALLRTQSHASTKIQIYFVRSFKNLPFEYPHSSASFLSRCELIRLWEANEKVIHNKQARVQADSKQHVNSFHLKLETIRVKSMKQRAGKHLKNVHSPWNFVLIKEA